MLCFKRFDLISKQMEINNKLEKLHYYSVGTVNMLQNDVTISLKLSFQRWMELSTCSMWVNVSH